jgi:hypothetical protein
MIVKLTPKLTGLAWALIQGIRRSSSCSASAIVSPPKKPVKMPIRVIQTWTEDRNRSGFSESSSAIRALRLAPACWRSRVLRAVITAISDNAKKPFNRISRKTMVSSSDMRATYWPNVASGTASGAGKSTTGRCVSNRA